MPTSRGNTIYGHPGGQMPYFLNQKCFRRAYPSLCRCSRQQISPRSSNPVIAAVLHSQRIEAWSSAAVSSKNTRRKVGHFSKAEHVVVQIGGRGIAEFRSNPGQDSKNSPRSSHPSPQKGCIHSKFYISRFVHLTCGDRVAPLKITEPYRWWREKYL